MEVLHLLDLQLHQVVVVEQLVSSAETQEVQVAVGPIQILLVDPQLDLLVEEQIEIRHQQVGVILAVQQVELAVEAAAGVLDLLVQLELLLDRMVVDLAVVD
jgi:hypothetical protein